MTNNRGALKFSFALFKAKCFQYPLHMYIVNDHVIAEVTFIISEATSSVQKVP